MSGQPKIEGDLEPIIRGDVRFGRNVRIAADWKRSKFVAFPGAVINIWDNVFINNGCLIVARKEVQIAFNTLIGNDVMIMDSNQHEVGNIEQKDTPIPIRIGDRVWICSRAIILPGVTISSGAVVGAGSVVTKDVPVYSMVAGNPARKIRDI